MGQDESVNVITKIKFQIGDYDEFMVKSEKLMAHSNAKDISDLLLKLVRDEYDKLCGQC